MDILIIAPTKTFQQDPAQKLVDPIVDHTDAVDLKQKLRKMVPPSAFKAPPQYNLKSHFDMRMIHKVEKEIELAARLKEVSDFENAFKNGVAFPATDDPERNIRYLENNEI
jgi:hypothetical protein